MKRTDINHVEWGRPFHMNQAELVEGLNRVLHFSGQVALVDDPDAEMGLRPIHVGDMRGQVGAALANIDELLKLAGMDRSNILTLRFYTTDVEALLANSDLFVGWVAEAGIKPPQTMLGVASLAVPELLIEIEAMAGD